jgi:tRNA-splicing endonuclease subunit Sen34
LKNKGYYITSGFKYGAEFLLYQDDPNFVHSEYILYINKYNEDISVKTIIKNERISVSNKKKHLIASIDDSGDIKFFNLSWKNI